MRYVGTFIVIAFLSLGLGNSLASGATVDGVTVMKQVQTFYDQTTQVTSDFQQAYYYQMYKRYQKSAGKVAFSKPGKMRWDYAQPNGKKIVSDGKTLRIYEPGEGKAPGQVFEQPVGKAELPQAMSFLTGKGRLADDFKPRLLDSVKHGFKDGFILELTPKKVTPHYQKVLLYVDKSTQRLGIVHRVLIIDAAGNRNRFDFTKMQFNRPQEKNFFSWVPPKGTRKISL